MPRAPPRVPNARVFTDPSRPRRARTARTSRRSRFERSQQNVHTRKSRIRLRQRSRAGRFIRCTVPGTRDPDRCNSRDSATGASTWRQPLRPTRGNRPRRGSGAPRRRRTSQGGGAERSIGALSGRSDVGATSVAVGPGRNLLVGSTSRPRRHFQRLGSRGRVARGRAPWWWCRLALRSTAAPLRRTKSRVRSPARSSAWWSSGTSASTRGRRLQGESPKRRERLRGRSRWRPLGNRHTRRGCRQTT